MTLSAAATRPGDDVRVVAGIANSSPDLSAQNASAQIELPPGAVLAPGSPPARQDLGTLATASPSTTPRTVTWVVRATGDGIRPIRVRSSAARYGEAFGSTDEVTFASDGTPPGVVLSAPAGELTDPRLPVTWTGTDTGVGVADYDIDVSTDGGPFEPWLAATTATSAVYPATAGRTYRFRARARDVLRSASAYVTSDPVRVVAPPIIGPPLLPPVLPPTPAAPVSPRLRVTSVKRRGHHLQLTGRIDSSAARAIAVRGSFKARRGRRELSASARPHGGRFTTRLRIGRPASGTITLRYAGDGALSAQATRVRVRGI